MARLSDKLARHAASEQGSATEGKMLPDGNETKDIGLNAPRDVLTELSLARIETDPDQPRKDLGDLSGLAASIREHGVIQPIIVTVAGYDRYRLLAGERRFSAAKLAGLTTVPVIVRSVEEQERLQLQIIENLHRKDLTPFEEAHAYESLLTQFSLKQEDIARRLGRSQETVSETLRLLDLPTEIQRDYTDANQATGGRITRSLLLEIARRPVGEQPTLWKQAREGELTVKKARAYRTSDKQMPQTVRAERYRYPIHLEGATVTVEFAKFRASGEEIVAALEAALASERNRSAKTP